MYLARTAIIVGCLLATPALAGNYGDCTACGGGGGVQIGPGRSFPQRSWMPGDGNIPSVGPSPRSFASVVGGWLSGLFSSKPPGSNPLSVGGAYNYSGGYSVGYSSGMEPEGRGSGVRAW